MYDANFIASVPIKNRTKEELLRTYQLTYKYLTNQGFTPWFHKKDNETSKDVEDFIASQNTNLQYTPPDMHQTNSAKRAIRTWKNHFSARLNPLLPAFEVMEGSFSFDATPMAPPSTEVLVHMKPTHHKSWAFHASMDGTSVRLSNTTAVSEPLWWTREENASLTRSATKTTPCQSPSLPPPITSLLPLKLSMLQSQESKKPPPLNSRPSRIFVLYFSGRTPVPEEPPSAPLSTTNPSTYGIPSRHT